jgi:hypothetical protein
MTNTTTTRLRLRRLSGRIGVEVMDADLGLLLDDEAARAEIGRAHV